MAESEALARRIRGHAIRMVNRGGASHIGSILSIADVLAVLYQGSLRVYPEQPKHPARDRLILSKGHAAAGLYAVLAERNFFPVPQLLSHCQDGTGFWGHVSHRGVPGVELSTGSLGHGLPVAAGMALAAKLDGAAWRAFAILSEGDCDEGSTWEAALFAGHHHLENLIAIVDYNKLQSLASVADTLDLEPFVDKWRSFGWAVVEVDGHNHDSLRSAFASIPVTAQRPSCFICHTVKGKGVSFMEGSVLWHYRTPTGDEYLEALREVGEPE
jgi:transketolase